MLKDPFWQLKLDIEFVSLYCNTGGIKMNKTQLIDKN